MDVPLPEIRARSQLLAAAYPVTSGDAGLQVLVDDAAGVLIGLTGRAIAVTAGGEGPFGCLLVDVPASLRTVALRAVTVFAERFHTANPTAAEREKALKRRSSGLASFSAGPYSESYFKPGDAIANQALDLDPDMARDLWSLATECVRLYWSRLWNPAAPPPPAAQTVSYDWSGDREINT